MIGIPVRRLTEIAEYQKRVMHVRCAACGESTREGKPYCMKHLNRMPAVRKLLAQIGKNMEDDAVANDITAVSAQSMLQVLRDSPATLRRLKKVLSLSEFSVNGYVNALQEAGLISVSFNARGERVASIK